MIAVEDGATHIFNESLREGETKCANGSREAIAKKTDFMIMTTVEDSATTIFNELLTEEGARSDQALSAGWPPTSSRSCFGRGRQDLTGI